MSYAFLFPGQGSQALGMGSFLVDQFPVASRIFEEASESIKLDLKKLCFNSSDADLAQTENTQPAIVTVSVSTFEVLKTEFGIQPSVVAGHSVGEYAALTAAKVFDLSTAVKAVRLRGQAMQSAVPIGHGGMIATLGLNEPQARYLCKLAMEKTGLSPLEPANFNCDGQIVLSGKVELINWLKDNYQPDVLVAAGLAKEVSEIKRVKFIPLQVSAPFHCSMMKPAEEKMAQFFETVPFHKASVPVIQNFTAKSVTESTPLKENLIRQISGSVQWTQSMLHLVQAFPGVQAIEVGHGQVLKGLMKKISPETTFFSTNTIDELKLIGGLK